MNLLIDEPKREAMGAAARAWAMRMFSWDVIAGQLEQVYAEAMKVQS